MVMFRPEITNFGSVPDLTLKTTHQLHMVSESVDFLSEGNRIVDTGRTIGAGAVTRSGTFEEAMLAAMDKVSAHQQFASHMNQMAITDPDSVNVHDITIAQAQANISLNITRNVLNRIVQAWRDLINTR